MAANESGPPPFLEQEKSDCDLGPQADADASDSAVSDQDPCTGDFAAESSVSQGKEEPVVDSVCDQIASCQPAFSSTQKDLDPKPPFTTTSTTTTMNSGNVFDDDDDDEDEEEESDAVPSNELCALHREGETELVQAVRLDHRERIRQLVRSGHDCNALCKWEGTACVVRVERENGFRKQLQMIGYSALHIAVIHSSLKTVKCLLRMGANVNIRDKMERTPLQLASAVNRPKMARLLIKAGSEVNSQSVSGRCPLIEAVSNLGTELSALLLEAGADPDVTDIKGTTPLTAALSAVGSFNIISGRNYNAVRTIVQNLIDAGCDVNKRNKAGAHALMLASGMKITPLMPLLISAGSDVNMTDRAGHTAFSMAIEGTRNVTTVKELMKHGAATHLADYKGNTPLSKVLKYGAATMLRLLLSADAVPHDYSILSVPRIMQVRQFVPEFDSWLHEEFHQPRSLMRLSREVIRVSLSPRNLSRIKELGLPLTLNTFVLGVTE